MKMKTLSSLGILCYIFGVCASLKIPDTYACGPCIQAQCAPVSLPCDGLFGLDDCYCCVTCLQVLDEVSEKSSSLRGHHLGHRVPAQQRLFEKLAALQKQGVPVITTSQPPHPDKSTHLHSGSSSQIDKEIGNRYKVKREVVYDALHDTVVTQTERSPTLEDKIRKTVRRTLLIPLQRGSQAAMDLGTMALNLFLKEKESELAGTAETSVNSGHPITKATHSIPKKEPNTSVNRRKRETEMANIRIMQSLYQVMMDGNAVLQTLTDSGPQQVVHCIISQVSVPRSHILADIARVLMEGIHESTVYISQSKSFIETPTWESLTQSILEAIDKGFSTASRYIPMILDAIKESLLLNSTHIENSKAAIKEIENTLAEIKEYMGSMNRLLEEVTQPVMRHRIKSEINQLLLPGSEVFAELVNAIMAITNTISKSILESAFMKEESSLQNLFESFKNGIIVGVTESYKVAPEVIRSIEEAIEKSSFAQEEETSNGNMEQFAILKATKTRPVLNAYLKFICDNFRYTKSTLQEQTTIHSQIITPPISELFEQIDADIIDMLADLGSVICTSAVLDEMDSWDHLIEVSSLIRDVGFVKLAYFQTKYNWNLPYLNKLLNYLGCDGTTKTVHHEDSLRNKTVLSITQSIFKHISNELQTKTNEMIVRNKILSAELAKLPGGEIVNLITNITLQVVNDMSRQMSISCFITGPPTWYKFWFSFIETLSVGARKAEAVFFEVLNTVKQTSSDKNIETLRTEWSERRKRSAGKVIPQVTDERNNPQMSPVPSSTPQTSATKAPPVTSTMKPDVKGTTAVTDAPKPCTHGKCEEHNVEVRRFTPDLLSQHILETFHKFLIQICKGVQDITGFLASLVVPPFIRSSGIPFANEVAEMASEVITLSSEVATKSLETAFLRNSPTWEAAEKFLTDSIRNAATGAIRLTIRFLSFVLNQLSEESSSISSLFKCKTTKTDHNKTASNVVISLRYEPVSNNTNLRESPLVQNLSSALSDLHDALSLAAVKNKDSKLIERSAPREQKFLILRFIRGIFRFEKLARKLISVLIPESCIAPTQQFLKQLASGISTLTGNLAQSGIGFQLKSSSLPSANSIADFVGKFLKTVNHLSSEAAESKYLNEPNPTWSLVNKAVTSGIKSGLQVSMNVIVKAMKLVGKALSNFPEILLEETDVPKRNKRNANVITVTPTQNKKESTLPPRTLERVKRSYLKRMKERDYSIL